MKKTGRAVMWLLAFTPLLLTALMYSRLPAQVPINWGISGAVSYGSRATLWQFAVLSPVLAAMFMLLPKIDPRRHNYEKFRELYDGFAIFMMLFMLGVTALIISESINPGGVSVELAVVAACGLLFMVIGNMLPKVKSNYFIGVKTPWTLSSTEVWNKTHRLAGYMFFFGGLLTVAAALLLRGAALFVVMMATVAVIVTVPVAMSYVWFNRCKNNYADAHEPAPK